MPVMDAERRELSELMEWASAQFGAPGERHPEFGVIPGMGINTLGDVMDGPWYQNRHGKKRMSLEELKRGTGDDRPPHTDEPWKALTVKAVGVRPGILIADSKYQLYLLRFDPPDHLEMSTGASMVASKIMYALGYNVLENYIVYFERDQLVASEAGEDVTSMGERRDLTEEDIDNFLKKVARDPEKGYRAVATTGSRSVGRHCSVPFKCSGRVATIPTTSYPTSTAGTCEDSSFFAPGSITPI